MTNTLLTPITLWKDFNDGLPLEWHILSEEREGSTIHRKLFFYGRETEQGRVKIFAHYYFPAEVEKYPAVLTAFEAGFSHDERFIEWLLERGYAVLVPDYCGEDGTGECTVYPSDVDYANFVRAGRAMTHVDETAKRTTWYEWAAVARYAVRFLREQKGVERVGAIGIRTGAEVLWKITPFAELDCFISICAGGWLAYRGRNKFGEKGNNVFDEERHRFIAGIDSQSYAPYCRCPVLFLNAINDQKYNCDRVYDTFRAVNPEVEKAILFSASGNGLLGSHSLVDLFLFLDKYLKGRFVYISKPIEVDTTEDEEGNLIAQGIYDSDGEIEESGLFFTEGVTDYRSCMWTRILSSEEVESNYHTFPLEVYANNERVLLYSFVRYSNGFSVTSKIRELPLTKRYKNMSARSRVIYGSEEGINGFSVYRPCGVPVADCFLPGERDVLVFVPGYGGIMGISSHTGLVTHRVGEPRFRAPEGVAFQLDAYTAEDSLCHVIFTMPAEGGQTAYECIVHVEGGGKWKRIVLEPEDFKTETGACLKDFTEVTSLILLGEGVLFNNVIWL